MKCGGRRAADENRLADVMNEGVQLRGKGVWTSGVSEAVGASLDEGAALDSAPKLAVRQAGVVRLRP